MTKNQRRSSRHRMQTRLGKHGKTKSTTRKLKRFNMKTYTKNSAIRRQAS